MNIACDQGNTLIFHNTPHIKQRVILGEDRGIFLSVDSPCYLAKCLPIMNEKRKVEIKLITIRLILTFEYIFRRRVKTDLSEIKDWF